MSGHTPGPWIIEIENPNDIVSDVYDVEICTIQPVDTGGLKNWDYGNQTKANARLIAAAPELLDAAIQARGVLNTVLAETSDETAIGVLKRRIATLSAAIAKAQG